MLVFLLYQIIAITIHKGIVPLAEDYIEQGKPHNEELVQKLLPALKIIHVINMIGKVLLLIASCRWPGTRYYFIYYHLYCGMVMLTFPIDYGEVKDRFVMNEIAIIQCCFAISFWPTLIASVGSMLYYQLIVRCFIYDTPLADLAGVAVASVIVISINTCMIFLFLKWVGINYVEVETMRAGNETLLNNVTEGIVIVDEQHGQQTFLNKTAKRFLASMKEAYSGSRGVFSTDGKEIFDKSLKQFSQMDTSIFDCGDNLLDRDKVIKRIKENSNYKSLDEIITQSKETEDSG